MAMSALKTERIAGVRADLVLKMHQVDRRVSDHFTPVGIACRLEGIPRSTYYRLKTRGADPERSTPNSFNPGDEIARASASDDTSPDAEGQGNKEG